MARGAKQSATKIADYRYDDTRKNIPSAGNAAQGRLQEAGKRHFSYDPHLPPELRFDSTGQKDGIPTLLAEARQRPLTADEVQVLAETLRDHQPWLEWAGKRESLGFNVEPVALNIHERVSTQAILKVAARLPVQRSLFADPEMEYREAVQFYQHDVDWTNRLILGDSLQVMASLAYREDLAGKVQMIYVDPPYGIKFASNFQPQIGRPSVAERPQDLTREPEVVRAYRDTWELGVHSYLAYLRDRLVCARELLTDSGSIFVQISEENCHHLRELMDEVFGAENFCGQIAFMKTAGLESDLLATVNDYILWYARRRQQIKYRQIYLPKQIGGPGASQYTWVESPDGASQRTMTSREVSAGLPPLDGGRVFSHQSAYTYGHATTTNFVYQHDGHDYYLPNGQRWRSTRDGMRRMAEANRFMVIGNSLRYKRYLDDFPVLPLTQAWLDTSVSGFGDPKVYVVQTNAKVIERCVLMATDPGDIVLDPTSGSGTTALASEKWGRRWIAIDTSRVANAVARQRLLTAHFSMYQVKGDNRSDPSKGFIYTTVPHITLRSIAQNTALDPICARHQEILNEKLEDLNAALRAVSTEMRRQLALKLAEKEKAEGKRVITEADRRRWILPRQCWHEWDAPYDVDPDWPEALKVGLDAYRTAWRAKMDEVNACIAAHADQEELVDQPEEVKDVTRVSGPFTVEAVIPQEESLDGESPIGGAPEELDVFEADGNTAAGVANGEAFVDRMIRLLRSDGVRFPNNRVIKFTRLEPLATGDYLHAEGEWQSEDGSEHRVAVSFGPEFGPVTAYQVDQALRMAYRRGYDDLVFAGFSFDAAAQAAIQEDPNPEVRSHLAHIRPDVNMDGLLKTVPNSQIFTVFGLPRVTVHHGDDDNYTIEMQGVDIYDPVANIVNPTKADKVAAWFLDTDYDGETFCIAQAFFPDKDAWKKLSRALKGFIDEDRFSQLSGTVSLPFPAGRYKQAAVKVIDPRGNEVMRIHRLDDEVRYGHS